MPRHFGTVTSIVAIAMAASLSTSSHAQFGGLGSGDRPSRSSGPKQAQPKAPSPSKGFSSPAASSKGRGPSGPTNSGGIEIEVKPIMTTTTATATTTVATLETDVERIVRKAMSGEVKPQLSRELNDRIHAAAQGATIEMGDYDMEALPILNITQLASGPPLLFADDPEYIRVPEGAVLRERINPGPNRFYLYHCNGTTGTVSKINAVIENLSDKPMKLRFLRYAFPGVGFDYADLGRRGIKMFLESKVQTWGEARVIPPHAIEPFDQAAETTTVKFDQLIHGFYEFEIDQPAQITVLQTTPDTPSPVAAKRIKDLLPPRSKSGAGRGYYPYSDYTVMNAPGEIMDVADGPRQIFIADGRLDRWLTGFDSSTSTSPIQLKGNYGVLYHITLRYKSSNGKSLALLEWNARTKSGCKAMSNCTHVGPGKFPAGSVMVPSDSNVLRGGDKAVLLQVFPAPKNGEEGTIEITYTPPGASCLPTPLLLVPVE
ncbi:MAG: hypothetical protein K1X53_03770 [Candidatus Sumerlaeaceae bacterium]|nr:hypothetical protein [Candidatus Sumerlaeaceae bacterium]